MMAIRKFITVNWSVIFAGYIGTIATSPILENVIDRVTRYKFMALKLQISAQLVSPTVDGKWIFKNLTENK